MKSKKEILKKAKETCHYENTECALYINGFLNGYKQCLKDYDIQDKENNTLDS